MGVTHYANFNLQFYSSAPGDSPLNLAPLIRRITCMRELSTLRLNMPSVANIGSDAVFMCAPWLRHTSRRPILTKHLKKSEISKKCSFPHHDFPRSWHDWRNLTSERRMEQQESKVGRQPRKFQHCYVSLSEEVRSHVDTACAAYHLGRQPQTMRVWACMENGPLRPTRVNGRLAWPVAEIKRVLLE